jgi:hypothetical protein
MSNFIRQQLSELVNHHGNILIEDANYCESQLHETFGNEYKLEIFLLSNAIKEGIVKELIGQPPQNTTQTAWLADLIQTFYDNSLEFLHLDKKLAKWTVQTWLFALRPAHLPSSEQASINHNFKRLSEWNPVDYFILLWWILVKPKQLQAYRKIFGDSDENRVGKWLVSSLTWWPLLIPILASGLGLFLPAPEEWPPYVYLLFSILIIGCWLITGWLGNIGEGSIMGNITFGVIFGMIFGVIYVVSIVSAFLLANEMSNHSSLGLTYIIAYIVAFYIAYVIAIIVAHSVKHTVTNSFINGTPSSLIRFAFALLVIAYLFLFWFCFLRGERLLINMS